MTFDQLEWLEAQARMLEPGAADRENWTSKAAQYGSAFIDGLPEGKTYLPDQDRGRALASLPFGEEGRGIDEVLEAIHLGVNSSGINPASGGHLGYVPGGGVFPSALGDYLAAVTNRYAGIFFANPGAVRMENDLIRWMCQLVGYPEGALGNLASGGSIANLIAITTARDYFQVKSASIPLLTIYLTSQVHHCVQKAIRIAGLGEAQIRYIPLDEQFRMQPGALQQAIDSDKSCGLIPFLVVASAGTTDTGAVDPLDEIADIAGKERIWYHVDAAYGGFFTLVEALRPTFKGIERSDSVAIDPHKGLFLPYGLGAVLIRNVEAQFKAHHYMGNYMQDAFGPEQEVSPADLSPELTKHFRGLRMWLPLQLLGLAPFRAALQEKVLLCRYFYEKVQALGFQTGPYPDLSIMIFRYAPSGKDANAFNEALVRYVQGDGRVFLSSTTIGDTYWIRLAVLSFRTHKREIDLCLDILRQGVTYLG
ncbi:MAG: aminotransferase class V-fold PLP-dependent enzyme [Haliscomenobacter sp.]|nr:aminotransferase class V-fold PLP-dependent enzyme [Haliscomenobacter sp.]